MARSVSTKHQFDGPMTCLAENWLSPVQLAVLDEMRRDPHVSKARIAERIERNTSTVDRAVAFFVNTAMCGT